jgi:dipeptidyl aminopeptidase/acylaminoacyl peptidase
MKTPKAHRPVHPDDLFKLRFLLEGQLSPDGQSVAFVVSHTHGDKDCAAIWLLLLETDEARQLTTGQMLDSHPRWSPDGEQIAFTSNRDGDRQIYLISVDGGEARPLTGMSQGIGGGPVWSPDGQSIAFTAGPTTPPLDLSKPYRITRHVYRFDGIGYLDNAVHDIYVVPVAGGEPRQMTQDGCHNRTPVWSPDGQEILFASSLCPDSHRVADALKIVNLEGKARALVNRWGYAMCAAWTPDGGRVVFIGNPWDVPMGTQFNLWVIDRRGGDAYCRTTALPLHVGGGLQPDFPALPVLRPRILITEDSQAAYLKVQDRGTVQVYRISLDGPESWAPVVSGSRACVPLSRVGERLLFAASTLHNPVDLFIADADGASEQQLTHFNAGVLHKRAQPTIKHLRFRSSDGVPVEGWVMTPSTGHAPYPTVLYIHGGPHSAFGHMFSFDLQMLAGAGYAALFINPRGSTRYGDAFSTQILGDLGRLEYEDLMAGVDTAIEQGIADPDRLGCYGHSYGGFLVCWIVGHTDRFSAAVAENPVTDWLSNYGTSDAGPAVRPQQLGGPPHEVPDVYRHCSALTYAHHCTTPTLLIQAEQDYRCPPGQAEQFYTILKASGCTVEMLRLPNASHLSSVAGPPDLRKVGNEALLDWMNRHVVGVSQHWTRTEERDG